MVPKLASKGTSFKGAAAYYLHDKGASTTERIAWTETVNLATHNPQTAWRVMAATATDQARLKEQAGIRATGRKSADVVLAYSLAWHPDEKAGLTREEMMLAARASLIALNAEHCQALIVAHRDEPHPHVHIILNRVSPADGRMLSSSNEKLNLSRWAEAYERGRGQILCEERVANNEARDRLRQHTRGGKNKARNRHEADKRENGGPLPRESKRIIEMRDEQRAKDAALADRGRAMAVRHRAAWDELRKAHRERRETILANTAADIRGLRTEVKEAALPAWRQMHKRHFAEQRLFEHRERRISGKIHNAIAAINAMGAVRGDASGRGFLGNAFRYLTSAADRSRALTDRQDTEKRSFAKDQLRQIKVTVSRFRDERQVALHGNVQRLSHERVELRTTQESDRQELKVAWRDRKIERDEARSRIKASQELKREVARSFARQHTHDRNGPER